MHTVLGDRRAIIVLVGPALIVYSLVVLVPIVWSMGYTVFAGNVVSGFSFVGLENFRAFGRDSTAWSSTFFTLRYAAVLTISQVALGYVLALMYVFWLRKASALVRTLVFFPVVLPTVALGLLFRRLFEIAPTLGPVNTMLEALGIGAIDWFGTPGAAFWVIIIMDLWRSMGFYAVLLYAGIIDIPEEVLESARVDGATGISLVRRIVLPLSFPVLLSAVIFSINGTLKVFDSVLALTGGGPGHATTPLTVYMYRTAFNYADYGYGSTIAFVLAVICLLVTVGIFRFTRRDATAN